LTGSLAFGDDRRMKLHLLIFLTLLSCTKYAEVNRDSVGTIISGINMEIYQLNEIKWFVGKQKEKKVTQSITFIASMPKLEEEDLKYLTESKEIDSWIVRLIVRKGGEERDLGSLYTLFKPRFEGRGASAGPASSVTIKIYYAAAYASERFRTFKCPAFEHNKKISSMEIRGSAEPLELIILASSSYKEKSQLIELTPSSFNGGLSLIGEYFLEIAPYDSKKKLIHSSFKRLPMSISVKEEESVEIPSCAGVHEELQ
jgi:hypothetical protein